MRDTSVILLSILLTACSASPSETETASSPPDSSGEEQVSTSETERETDEGAVCAGPFHRASNGAIACPSRDGHWSQLLGCYGCELQGEECRTDGDQVSYHVPACRVGESCPEAPRARGPGACNPVCCDASLPPVPPEVDGTFIDPMPDL